MRVKKTLLVPLAATLTLSMGLAAAPAAALQRTPVPEPTENAWQMRHWPQTQPWQRPQQARTYARAPPGRWTPRTTSSPTP
ncbi:hypothetical protein [Actinomadura sp. 21ATH]|uniref:hypothetical protein n=1 Tax=Actinomadura sp. 21ATH TaxID=1735444 RepID=UPI0035C17113